MWQACITSYLEVYVTSCYRISFSFLEHENLIHFAMYRTGPETDLIIFIYIKKRTFSAVSSFELLEQLVMKSIKLQSHSLSVIIYETLLQFKHSNLEINFRYSIIPEIFAHCCKTILFAVNYKTILAT